MNRIIQIIKTILVFTMGFCLIGCGKNTVADYGNAEAFEAALNNGDNLEGKIVIFTAGEVHPDSALGYNIWAGEHLNFVSAKNPDVKQGDSVAVKIISVENGLGSWIITYEKIKDVVVTESTIIETNSGSNTELNNVEMPLVVENNIGNKIDNDAVSSGANIPQELTLEYVDMDAKGFKDYFGTPTLSAYVAVKNNNEVPITFSNLSLDLEDDNGKLLGTDTSAKCIPEAIKPGQIGYIYTYYYDMTGIDLDNGLQLQPNGDVIVADNFCEIEVSDISAKAGSALDISVIGRGTNNTGVEQAFAEPGAVFFDADGNVVGFCYGLESFPADQTTTFEISGDMMSEDMSSSLVDHVEVFIQGNGW